MLPLRTLRPTVYGGKGHKRLLRVVAFRERTHDSFDGKSKSSSSSNKGLVQQPGSNGVHAKRDFLEARQVSLYELFDGNAFQLDVPEYQRPYAWRAKQVQELLSDLQLAFSTQQEHFLGALVTTRRGDAPGEPYWVIDGQQRLTTLVMLLSYLRAWSATQPGLESLAERVHRMLLIPADPLSTDSKARYRLQLRSSDQAFFANNFIHAYLPHRYHLSMSLDSPANAAGDYHEASTAQQQQQQQQQQRGRRRPSSSSSSSPLEAVQQQQRLQPRQQQQQQQGKEVMKSIPLENETWWRLYCAGDVLASYLAHAMDNGLNLQDFVHYVLKNCMVVLMTARDEHTSFKIFSTLNGRGVDLAVIDKLKPELLQALPVRLREEYADRWTALESSLGRPSFHALFNHRVILEQAAEAAAPQSSSRPDTFSHTSNGSSGSSGGSTQQQQRSQQEFSNNGFAEEAGTSPARKGFIPPGSVLGGQPSVHYSQPAPHTNTGTAGTAAHSSSSSGSWLLSSRPDVLEYFSSRSDVEGVLNQVMEYGKRLLQIRANDWSALAAEGGSAPAIAAELEEACFFINLLSDDSWQPWVLEFFYQSDDDAKRAAFLRGAEVLQLYCELKQDEAFKHERWLAVGTELLQRPFYSDQVLAALTLSPDECDDFIKLLDSRELAASADDGLLVHLLLRADSISRRHLDWRRLKVEKIMPSNPPDRSPWRKQKLLLPALSEEALATSAAVGSSGASSSSTAGFGLFNPTRSRSSSGGSSSSRAGRSRTTSSSSTGSNAMGATVSADASSRSSSGSSSISSVDALTASSSSSSNVPAGMREVRYWHEITRNHWHNRLGNLVLLQPSGHEQSTSSSHLSADLPTKLQYYAACAADERFPDFTGGLVNGRYSRDMFSPEECRQRHADIMSRLIHVFGLSSPSAGF